MENIHTETVVEKAVSYVKDMLGIHPAEPDVVAKPEYSDSEPEIDTEDAMLRNPNAYTMKSIGELSSETPLSPESALERTESASGAGEIGADPEYGEAPTLDERAAPRVPTEDPMPFEPRTGATKSGAPIDPEDAMFLRAVERD